MKNQLKKELSKLSKNFIILAKSNQERHEELNLFLLKEIIGGGKTSGAYIAINKPYRKLIEIMDAKKIKHENLFFIDCVTKKGIDSDNCVFIHSPLKLMSIGIALDSIYKDKNYSFIFLDSIDSLLAYHNNKTVIRFVRTIMERTRENNMKGVMVSLKEKPDKFLSSELSLICDKIIDLE